VRSVEDHEPRDEDGQSRDPDDYDPRYGDDAEPRDSDGTDELEAEIMQADHPFGMGLWGTTAEEELAGEGLDRALAQERPETAPTEDALEVVDEELVDSEEELVGEAVLARDEFAPPEEAALSITDDPPGATDHEDPHPDQDADEESDEF
jgi:hypothetical protein